MSELARTVYLSAVETQGYADDDQSPENSSHIVGDGAANIMSGNMIDSIAANRAANEVARGVAAGAMATGAMATGAMATGAMATGAVLSNNPFGGSFHEDNIQSTGSMQGTGGMNYPPAHIPNNSESVDINQHIEDSKNRIKDLANSLLGSFVVHGSMGNANGNDTSNQEMSGSFQRPHHNELPYGSTYPYTHTQAPPSVDMHDSTYNHFVSPDSSYYEPESNTYYQHTSATLAHENLAIHLNKYIKWYMVSLVILFAIQVFNAITTPNVSAKIFSVLCAVFAFLCIGYLEKIRRRWLDDN